MATRRFTFPCRALSSRVFDVFFELPAMQSAASRLVKVTTGPTILEEKGKGDRLPMIAVEDIGWFWWPEPAADCISRRTDSDRYGLVRRL
jgi:hypothetical protein